MSKILVVKNITSCSQCPYCDWIEIECVYNCFKITSDYFKEHRTTKGAPDDFVTDSFIKSMPEGEYYDENKHKLKVMPDWCPLPEQEEK